ncbi:2-oxo-tetronate isomerase [Lacibacterium aquatile]|uniref:2-oxo-tetronate isomerase n=1 Tax=Lacibacterium aquatile TaxID=1168082 RepID=A0ABW5DRZ9_9PROT
MIKLAANLSMLFPDAPFLDRFGRAAAAGFKGVEYIGPYDHGPEEVVRALKDGGLTQVLFNLPPGNWAAGERGFAAIPGREAEQADALRLAIDYARALDCPRLHVMAGIIPAGGDLEVARRTFVSNVQKACDAAAPHGIQILLEPINNRDMPGYFLNYQAQALGIMDAVARPNLALQMDFYHAQVMEGDLTRKFQANLPRIGHLQIAGMPDRHEPDEGEVAYDWLLGTIAASGYKGWIGCEYRPKGRTEDGLGWAEEWL